MYKIYAGMSQRPQSLQRNPRALLNMKITKYGYAESPSYAVSTTKGTKKTR